MERPARERSNTPAKHTRKAVTAKNPSAAPPEARAKEPAKATPRRRAGDVEQAWQRAKLDPATWPFPSPIHGKAGLTWAVLPTGETVKWSDLGMDRRLEGRVKVWLAKDRQQAK